MRVNWCPCELLVVKRACRCVNVLVCVGVCVLERENERGRPLPEKRRTSKLRHTPTERPTKPNTLWDQLRSSLKLIRLNRVFQSCGDKKIH